MTIDGRKLIEWGFKPGAWFKNAIHRAQEMDRSGVPEEDIRAAIGLLVPAPAVPLPKVAPDGVVTVAEPSDAPIKIVGDHEERTIAQLQRCMGYGSVVGAAICADGHLGYAQPVGGVIAYAEHISVSGVGFDIACGNMAVRTDVLLEDLTSDDLTSLANDISRNLSFGVGRVNAEKTEHPLFDDDDLWRAAGVGELKQMAADQLGTIGSGNHYVDIFADDSGAIWIGVHFGSRGLGHKSATKYLKAAGGQDGIDVPPTVLHVDSEIGQSYLAAMKLAGLYAYAGREWVVGRVRKMLGGSVVDTVHNHHNFAWLEPHHGKQMWVVRKGATPAYPGERGFVGGSMADDAVIIEGVDSPEASALFHSTIHGAGRTFGRREAKRRFTLPEMHEWLHRKGVILRGAGLDESPMAYRRLDDVLAAHAGTIRIVHRLKPLVVVMAGEGEVDPYKD